MFHGPLVLAADPGPVPDPQSQDALYVLVLQTKDPDPAHWLDVSGTEFNASWTTGEPTRGRWS
ncbi:MAG: hypothetical protein R2751_20085 [Bacteroidales bacterium]